MKTNLWMYSQGIMLLITLHSFREFVNNYTTIKSAMIVECKLAWYHHSRGANKDQGRQYT